MIVKERKSKYKHKIVVSLAQSTYDDRKEVAMRKWCTETFGEGGRRERWRFGWTQKDITFYFRQPKDSMLFTLKWSCSLKNTL
jgi:hypothetical protein